MRTPFYFLLLAAVLLAACSGDGEHRRALDAAYSLINDRPDSALAILDAMPQPEATLLSKGQLRRWQLLRLMAQNKCDTVFRSDSLQRVLTDYYDQHGTPNERMWAHYLLGRAYYDMGEMPMALKEYLSAEESADTLSEGCDFWNLCRVYFMLSELHLQSMLPREMLSTLSLAQTTAGKAGDTLSAIMAVSRKALAYEILGDDDSIIICSEEASRLSLLQGQRALSSQCLSVAVPPLVKKGELEKAARYINLYEGFSGFFDDSHDIQVGSEIYYHTKGSYYLEAGKADSAEWMFRKLLSHAQTINDFHAAYLGLRNKYEKTGPADSLAKYAVLSEQYDDSLYQSNYSTDLQRNGRMYDYTRHLELARKMQGVADKRRMWIIGISSLLLILMLTTGIVFTNVRLRHKRLLLEYKNLLSLFKQLKEDKDNGGEADNKEKQRLAARIEELQSTIKNEITDDLDHILAASSVVKRIKDKVRDKDKMKEEDWLELDELFDREYPNFRHALCDIHGLKDNEYRVCQLARLRFQRNVISLLMNHDQSYATHAKERIYEKITGKKGKAKELDKILIKIKRI